MARNFALLSFFALVSVQVCLAGPTTTPAPAALPSFSEIIANAQKAFNENTAHIQKMLNLPDVKNVDQVVAIVKNASTDFSKKMNDILATAKTEALAPLQKQTESLFRNFSQSVMDIQKDLSRYNASAGGELLLQTVDKYVAKIKEQLGKERELLGRVEFKQFGNMALNTSANLVQQGVKAYEEVRKKVDPTTKAAAAAFQDFYKEINKTTEELKKKIPEFNASNMGEFYNKTLASVMAEGEKLRTALEKEAPHASESLTKAAQNIIESAVKAANSFADQVHETVGHDKHPEHAAHHKA